MPTIAILLVLLSALLHTVWNAFARAQSGALSALWLLALGGGAAGALGLALGAGGRPPAALWPFIAASAAIHFGYFYALSRLYQRSELSWSYSIARGIGLLLTAPLAAIVLAQFLPPLGWIGVLLVAAGLILMHWDALRTDPAERRAAWVWSFGVGLCTAAYSLVDSRAVHLGPPLPYLTFVYLGAAILLAPLALRRIELRAIPVSMGAGAISLVSYLLMLMSYRMAPVAEALALRQVAPVFALLLGWAALRERPAALRLSGTAVIVLGSMLATLR